MITDISIENITELLVHQLNSWWGDAYSQAIVRDNVAEALEKVEQGYSGLSAQHFCENGVVKFSPFHSVSWSVFLYRLSRILFLQENLREANVVYYLNKIIHSIDWFYGVDLPVHFMAEHPLGTILGKASYGDYLFVYQGVTVGGNRKDGKLYYPVLGENVVLYANATLLGDTHIGNNVIISANTYLISENVPDNCIVFGKTPNVVIKQKTEKEIYQMTRAFWNWDNRGTTLVSDRASS